MKDFAWQKNDSNNKNDKLSGDFKGKLIIFLIISCVVLLGALIYVLLYNANNDPVKNQIDQKSNNLTYNNLIATINQDPIYVNDVLAIYDAYPQELKTDAGLQQALDKVINNKLLLQEAKRRGIDVSSKEIDDAVNSFLTTNSLTLQTLEQNLKNINFTLSQFKASTRDNLLIQKVGVDITKDVAAPTEAEIRAYYDVNSNNLTILGTSITRQIFIFANQSNADSKLEEIRNIASKLNTTNFCEMVTVYSEDTTTNKNCGLYETTQGQLLPEYEQAVYNSTPGEVRLVGTRIGYHIILVENVTQPRKATFTEAKDQLSQYLLLLKKQNVLIDFIKQLRNKAEIVDYLNK